jgi:spore maturation protein SpmA
MNIIWVVLIFLAALTSYGRLIFFDDFNSFNLMLNSAFTSAKTAVEMAIGLTGLMALWLGLMRISQKSGIVSILTNLFAPYFSRIFPEIPERHPARESITLNFIANIFGLNNAATPLGLKAMGDLQKLNTEKDSISHSQAMFLVINSSSLSILPVSIFSLLYSLGYGNPAEFFFPILIATICSTLAGILMTCYFQKINILDTGLVFIIAQIALTSIVTFIILLISDTVDIRQVATNSTSLAIFSLIILIVLSGILKKVDVYSEFIEGAKEGFSIAINIIPYLVAIFVAIAFIRESGFAQIITNFIGNVFNSKGFAEVFQAAITLPLSGAGTKLLVENAYATHGLSSFVAKMITVISGSSDTTLYIFAVYLGSVKISKARYALFCALFADLIGVLAAILMGYIFFYN